MSRSAWDDVLRLTGRTTTQIAEIADVPRATISGLYGGHANASVAMAVKIANAAGVHPETLFPGLIVRTIAADLEAAR